jgi:tRNA-uridine 2-sulfurtransferase
MSSQPMFSESVPEESLPGRKAVALLSGGLDSALAIYLVKRQGIDVVAVHFTSFFSLLDAGDEESPVRRLARQLKVPLRLLPKGKDFLQIIRNPRYGHGKNLNPCIDCRIYTFVKAKKLMEEIGASFIVTGEVVGQRPMSQRRNAIRLIEKRSGCDGLVLRPLSAKLLPETRMEEAGFVDREQLLDVAGRGRKVQIRMAAELGLSGYSAPAGGCLLTDKRFSSRVRDLLAHTDDISAADLELLHIGRHLRIRPGLKIVIGRNEAENNRIEPLATVGSLFSPVNFPGPLVLALGRVEPDDEALIGSVLRRYAKESSRGEWISVQADKGGERRIRVVDQADKDWISDHMI